MVSVGSFHPSENAGMRDAIHVPVAIVSSCECLMPGDRVRFLTDEVVVPCSEVDSQGIVDPFLLTGVPPGTLCLVMVRPGTVTVRHHFDLGVPTAEEMRKGRSGHIPHADDCYEDC